MINKDLVIKSLGAQFMDIMKASEQRADEIISEINETYESIDKIRADKAEVVKQLLLIDMMKSELLLKLNESNQGLNAKKEELRAKVKRAKEEQVHKMYPEVFMNIDINKDIDNINGTNYRN